MRKRIFTSLLAIAMVMAMIPAALAEEPGQRGSIQLYIHAE